MTAATQRARVNRLAITYRTSCEKSRVSLEIEANRVVAKHFDDALRCAREERAPGGGIFTADLLAPT